MSDKIKVIGSFDETNWETIGVTYSQFPAGEEYVRINSSLPYRKVKVIVVCPQAQTLMQSCLIADAVKYINNHIEVIAQFDYFPYGRQDRVCAVGESYSLNFFCEMLKLRFDHVITHDVHSQKTIDCLGEAFQLKTYKKLYQDIEYINVKTKVTSELNTIFNSDYVVVSVDKGAIERSQRFARYINSSKIFYLSKTRKDGTIVVEQADNSNIDMIKNNQHFVLSDDIGDGNFSFIVASKFILNINPTAKISLVLSHGIFSKGLEVTDPFIENIYVVNDAYNNYRLSLLKTK